MAPEPVVGSIAPTRRRTGGHRIVSRLRALVGLVLLIALASAGLAAGVGLAIAALSLALKKSLGN